jgi:hypothetical protein
LSKSNKIELLNGSSIAIRDEGEPFADEFNFIGSEERKLLKVIMPHQIFYFDLSGIERDPLLNLEALRVKLADLPLYLRQHAMAMIYDYVELKGYVRSERVEN